MRSGPVLFVCALAICLPGFPRAVVADTSSLTVEEPAAVDPVGAVAAGKRAGRTLTVKTSGLPLRSKASIPIKGPGGYKKTIRFRTKKTLRGLDPGRYRLTAKPVGNTEPTKAVKRARVKKARAALVKFRFAAAPAKPSPVPPPGAVTPAGVSRLSVSRTTAFSVSLAWSNPTSLDLDRVIIRRAEGTSPPPSPHNGIAVTTSDNAAESVTDAGLSPSSAYSYAVFVRYRDGSTSAAAVTTARTLGVGDIEASDSRTCAIDWTGKAWCWGAAPLGDGGTTSSPIPVAVDTAGPLGGKVLTGVASGLRHTCVLDQAGRAYCWGRNASGGLGTGTTTDSPLPVAREGRRRVGRQVARRHHCGV